MKIAIVMILCLGVAYAIPQGLGGFGISGQQGFGGQPGFGFGGATGPLCQQCEQQRRTTGRQGFGCAGLVPNNNRRATLCPGNLLNTCFGSGLENPCAMYVFPQTVQCLARAAMQASTGGDSFKVRVNFDGTAFITDTFGTNLEDIEVVETGFDFASQQRNQQTQFKYEQLQTYTETFCGGNQR